MAIFRQEESIQTSETKPTTVIGRGISAQGDIEGAGDIVVEGKVKGKITTSGTVRIGREAEIHADIHASSVHIAGTIHGNVSSKEIVELSETGKLWGNIKSKAVNIASGAIFNGSCQMGEESQKENLKK